MAAILIASACGQIELHLPTPYAGAYVTSVCNALSQCTTKTYNLNPGLLASVTDPNNKTTNYNYDDIGPVTNITNPDQGQSNFFYPDFVTVEKKQLLTANPGVWTDEYYSPDGKLLGTDGVKNGAVAIVPDGVIKSPDGKVVSNAETFPSVVISRDVGVAIQASVTRADQPSGADTKGGFHEEGFTVDKDGTIHTAQPGPAFERTDTEAHVKLWITSNTAIAEHTHPGGTKDAGGTITVRGTAFGPKPSPPDIRNAGDTPVPGQQIVCIEASAGDRTVYFYNDKGVYARVPLSAFPEK